VVASVTNLTIEASGSDVSELSDAERVLIVLIVLVLRFLEAYIGRYLICGCSVQSSLITRWIRPRGSDDDVTNQRSWIGNPTNV
jgi:hypothetical protein